MTINFVTENKCECHGVTFQINGYVKVQKFEDISNDENTIYCVKLMRTFLVKSQVCNINKSTFDGNTILLKISEENGKHNYAYIGGDMICSFMTNDNIYEYISNMGNNLCPYSVAIGEENYNLLTPNFKFFKKDKIDYDAILDGMYPCEGESFIKLELCKIHSSYD